MMALFALRINLWLIKVSIFPVLTLIGCMYGARTSCCSMSNMQIWVRDSRSGARVVKQLKT